MGATQNTDETRQNTASAGPQRRPWLRSQPVAIYLFALVLVILIPALVVSLVLLVPVLRLVGLRLLAGIAHLHRRILGAGLLAALHGGGFFAFVVLGHVTLLLRKKPRWPWQGCRW